MDGGYELSMGRHDPYGNPVWSSDRKYAGGDRRGAGICEGGGKPLHYYDRRYVFVGRGDGGGAMCGADRSTVTENTAPDTLSISGDSWRA